MRLANPDALRLLVLVPLLLALLWWSYGRNMRLLGLLREAGEARATYIVFASLLTIMVLSLIGIAAQPQLTLRASGGQTPRGDYVFLIDMSRSMLARSSTSDPSNLERARAMVAQVVRGMPEARFALAGYAGLPFPLSTFSNDAAYLDDVVNHGVGVGIVPRAGSNLPAALALIARHKHEDPLYEKVSQVILVADGNITEAQKDLFTRALELATTAGLSITTVGIGDVNGQRIPVVDEHGMVTQKYEALKDGTQVVTYLNEATLRAIADRTGGKYFTQGQIPELIEHLRSKLAPRTNSTITEATVVVGSRDMSWVLLIPFTVALAVLLWNRQMMS